MQRQGVKLAHAAAPRDFYLVFFLAQTLVCGLARCIEKIPFPLRRAHRLPFPSFNPNNTPPPAHAPLPSTSYKGACGVGFVILRFQGSRCSSYFCSVGQIKNHHDASHFPLPRPSILIIPPLCPRTLSPNNHMSRDVVVAKTDEDAAGASDDDDDNSYDEHDDDDDDDEDDDAAIAADVEDDNRHHHQPI
jgi:hypothetical protein